MRYAQALLFAFLGRFGSEGLRFGAQLRNGYMVEVSFPKISRQFFDYIPTLVDIYSGYVDIFLS